jgi:hypothetical protein
MRSDALKTSALSPKYGMLWKEVFCGLVKDLLCKQVSVETTDDKEMAIIHSKGYILGCVSSVKFDAPWGDTQSVGIIFKDSLGDPRYIRTWFRVWRLSISAKPIQRHDLVCLIQGASEPTIIRACKYHVAVIVIAATPPTVEWRERLGSINTFPLDFQLMWSWGNPSDVLDYREVCEALMYTNSLAPENEDYLDRAVKMLQLSARVKRDGIEIYSTGLGKKTAHYLSGITNLALTFSRNSRGDFPEESVIQIARFVDKEMMMLLLVRRGLGTRITEKVSKAVVGNLSSGKEAIKLSWSEEGTTSKSQKIWSRL